VIVCSCAVCPHPRDVHEAQAPQLDRDGELNGATMPDPASRCNSRHASDLRFWAVADLHAEALWRRLHPRVCPAARWAEKDLLAGAVVWAHDAQVHMLVLPTQRANSERRVLTSCGTRV
jgi:hypothetical protein